MAEDASQIKVAATGKIYIAAFSAEPTLPTDVSTAVDEGFTELGYVSDDGVTFTESEETEDVMVWQKQNPARRITTARNFAAAMPLAQWNRETVEAAFGGGAWTEPSEGVYRFDPPADSDPLAEWVVVIEAEDGERKDRWVIEKANVTGEIETQYVRNAPALLPVTFSALTPDEKEKPWYYLTNDEAMAPSS